MNRIVSSLTALCVIAGSMTVNTDASSKNTKKSPDWDFNNPQLSCANHFVMPFAARIIAKMYLSIFYTQIAVCVRSYISGYAGSGSFCHFKAC